MRRHDLTKKDNDKDKYKVKDNDEYSKNRVQIENHLDWTSVHFLKPIIQRGKKKAADFLLPSTC